MGKWDNYVIWVEKTMSYVGKGQAGNPVLIDSNINVNGVTSVSYDNVFTSNCAIKNSYSYRLKKPY